MIVTFAYLLCPIIAPNILKRPLEQIMVFKVAKPLANVVTNQPFGAKQNIFWEILLLLLSTYCIVLYYNFQKNFLQADHQTRLDNFGPNWARVTPSTKRELFGKVDQHYFGFLQPIMLHNFKKILREQIMRIRLHNFCPNCPLPQKGIFFKN